jgi:hypothetical protein
VEFRRLQKESGAKTKNSDVAGKRLLKSNVEDGDVAIE